MAAYGERPLPATPHPYHPDYIWPVDLNQGLEARYPCGDPFLNGLEVAPASEKEVAIAHEIEFAASIRAQRSSTVQQRLRSLWPQAGKLLGAERKGPFLGLPRRLFIILFVTALVIAGLVILAVKLVSRSAIKSSSQPEVDPIRDLRAYYTLRNTGLDPNVNLSLTADINGTSEQGSHPRLEEQELLNRSHYQEYAFDWLNNSDSDVISYWNIKNNQMRAANLPSMKQNVNFYYIINRGLLDDTGFTYGLGLNMTGTREIETCLDHVEVQWDPRNNGAKTDTEWRHFRNCKAAPPRIYREQGEYSCELHNAALGDFWFLTANTLDDVTVLKGRTEIGARIIVMVVMSRSCGLLRWWWRWKKVLKSGGLPA